MNAPASARARRSQIVVDHSSVNDPAEAVEVTTTHYGLYAAYLILYRHLRTGSMDARPALYNATIAVARCFQTAGLRAAQVCRNATVIVDRNHFEDILAVIAADERASDFHVQQFLTDATAAA